MACFVSDGFQEALGESVTALKLGGLVLKEEQKAALYAVTLKSKIVYTFYRRVLGSPSFYFIIMFTYFILFIIIIFTYFILFTQEVARPWNAGRK